MSKTTTVFALTEDQIEAIEENALLAADGSCGEHTEDSAHECVTACLDGQYEIRPDQDRDEVVRAACGVWLAAFRDARAGGATCIAPIDDASDQHLCGASATTERTVEGLACPLCAERAAEIDGE